MKDYTDIDRGGRIIDTSSHLRDLRDAFRQREGLWSGIKDQLSGAFTSHRDSVHEAEAEFQRMRKANRAVEGFLGISGARKIAEDAATYRFSHTLNAGVINRINPLSPTNASIAAMSSIPLAERVQKQAEFDKSFERPSSLLGLSERQEHTAAKALKEYDRLINSDDRHAMRDAKRILERPFSRFAKAKAFMTGDRHTLYNMRHVEQKLAEVRDSNLSYFEEARKARKPLKASIEVEQRDVAKTIANTLKPGIFGGASFKDTLDVLSEEQIASNEKLATLADIIEQSPSAKKKDILKTMREHHPAFSHKDLREAVRAADSIIKPMREAALEEKQLAEVRRDMVKKYTAKIETLAGRETTIKLGGKDRSIAQMLDKALDEGEDTMIPEDVQQKLMDRIADLGLDGRVSDKELAVIRTGVNIMSNPKFNPDDVPDIEMDAIFKAKAWDHHKRMARDGVLTAGKWTNENIVNPAKKAASKVGEQITTVADKAGEAYVRASAAFDEAVQKNVTHPVQSAWHDVKDTARRGATAAAFTVGTRDGNMPDVPAWMTAIGKPSDKGHSAFYADLHGESDGAQQQPAIFAAAAEVSKSAATDESGSSDGSVTEDAAPEDTLAEETSHEVLTEDSPTMGGIQ